MVLIKKIQKETLFSESIYIQVNKRETKQKKKKKIKIQKVLVIKNLFFFFL